MKIYKCVTHNLRHCEFLQLQGFLGLLVVIVGRGPVCVDEVVESTPNREGLCRSCVHVWVLCVCVCVCVYAGVGICPHVCAWVGRQEKRSNCLSHSRWIIVVVSQLTQVCRLEVQQQELWSSEEHPAIIIQVTQFFILKQQNFFWTGSVLETFSRINRRVCFRRRITHSYATTYMYYLKRVFHVIYNWQFS